MTESRCEVPHKKLSSRLSASGSWSLPPPPPIMSSPPWPNREAVDASEDANDETDPVGMNGDATDDGTGEDGDVKKEGPAAAEVDEEGGGDAEAPGAEADMRW